MNIFIGSPVQHRNFVLVERSPCIIFPQTFGNNHCLTMGTKKANIKKRKDVTVAKLSSTLSGCTLLSLLTIILCLVSFQKASVFKVCQTISMGEEYR